MTDVLFSNRISEEASPPGRLEKRLESSQNQQQRDFRAILETLPDKEKISNKKDVDKISSLDLAGEEVVSPIQLIEDSPDKFQDTAFNNRKEIIGSGDHINASIIGVQVDIASIRLIEGFNEAFYEVPDLSLKNVLESKDDSSHEDSLEKSECGDFLNIFYRVAVHKENVQKTEYPISSFGESPFLAMPKSVAADIRGSSENRKDIFLNAEIASQAKISVMDTMQNSDFMRTEFPLENIQLPNGIEVLESRRFCGIMCSHNNISIIDNIVENVDLKTAMQSSHLENFNNTTHDSINTLKIQMQPRNLGSVIATLRLSGNGLIISLGVETSRLYKQLHYDRKHILDALKLQGYNIDRLDLNFIPENSTNFNKDCIELNAQSQLFQQSEDLSEHQKQKGERWNLDERFVSEHAVKKEEGRDVHNKGGIVDMYTGYVYI